MAIKREVTVTITGAKSSLDGKIIVFRNDRGIDLHLTFKNFDYIIGDLETPVMSATATVAKPNGYDKFDVELTVIDETVIFTITNDMTDEMEEVGVYKVQIHFFDKKGNRISIPPFSFTVQPLIDDELEEPPDVPSVYARADFDNADMCMVAPLSDNEGDIIIEGQYVRTHWYAGDLITSARLNNLETGVSNTILELLTYKDEVDEKLRQMLILINEANYKEITTTKYSVYPTNAEIGSIVNASLSWEYNKDIVTFQKINGVELGINERSYTVTNISSNTSFKLEFSDGTTDASKTISLTFLNSRCYGVGSTKTYDSELIGTLTKVLTGSRACSFTVNSGDGQFIYYAIPTRFGKPTFYVGGFEGGFFLANTIDYTNPSGYTESYDIYRSDYSGLGDTTVVVK